MKITKIVKSNIQKKNLFILQNNFEKPILKSIEIYNDHNTT